MAIREVIRFLRFFIGATAIVSSIMGLTVFGFDSLDPVNQILGMIIAVGVGPMGLYLISDIFVDGDSGER